MTTPRATDPARMALPPPLDMNLRVGDHHVVGWIAGRTLGFRGFATATEAAGAAWVAYRKAARRLARDAGRRPIPIDVAPVEIARRDGREVIRAGHLEIAALVRPGDGSRSGPESFGFEIEIPEAPESTIRANTCARPPTSRS